MTIVDDTIADVKPRHEPLTSSTVPKTFRPEKICAVPQRDLPANAGVSVRVEYCNHTKTMLYLKTQAGIVTVLPANTDETLSRRNDRHLEIRITTTISRSEGVRVTKNVLEAHRLEQKVYPMTHDASVYLDGILSEQMREGEVRGLSSFSQTAVVYINYAQLSKLEAMYIRETDCLVSIHPSLARVPHPNSSEGLAALEVGRVKPTPGHVGIMVRAIDNEGLAGRRYMFSGKDVITIPTFEDPKLESGVYITTMNSDINGDITRTTVKYTYEEAERDHGVYRTKEHAYTSGDPKAKLVHDTEQLKVVNMERKMEESQSGHDLKIMENRWAAFLTEQRQTNAELERVREERHRMLMQELQEKTQLTDRIRQLEKEAVERDSMNRKDYYESRSRHRDDYYESRSSQRKDYSEILKYVPAFIMGIAGAFVILRSTGGGKANYV